MFREFKQVHGDCMFLRKTNWARSDYIRLAGRQVHCHRGLGV